MKEVFFKVRKILYQRVSQRLETGFSMLEAVVVVGVVIALAVTGFISYGPIVSNAKQARVEATASDIYVATVIRHFDGDASTDPQDAVRDWNSSTDKIKVDIVNLGVAASSNGDYCVSATNTAEPQYTALRGTCSTGDIDTTPIIQPNPDTPGDTAPVTPPTPGGGGEVQDTTVWRTSVTHNGATSGVPVPLTVNVSSPSGTEQINKVLNIEANLNGEKKAQVFLENVDLTGNSTHELSLEALPAGTYDLTVTVFNEGWSSQVYYSEAGTLVVSHTPAPTPPETDPIPAVRDSAQLRFGLVNDDTNVGNGTDATKRLVGESPSISSFYRDWRTEVDFKALSAITAEGATPMITWEPWDPTRGLNQPEYRLSTIINGSHDEYIKTWARDLKSFEEPVMIRFAHEMNGNWYPWSEQVNGNSEGEYVAAWKHVVDVFRAEGANNVEWIWAPNTQHADVSTAALYPGDDYVDYTGIDGFNWGASRPWTGGWTQPWDIFDADIREIFRIAPTKKLIITEVGSVESLDGTNSKAKWITDFMYYIDHFDSTQGEIAGFIWFDIEEWRIGTSAESAEAMKKALSDRES